MKDEQEEEEGGYHQDDEAGSEEEGDSEDEEGNADPKACSNFVSSSTIYTHCHTRIELNSSIDWWGESRRR
jgi:hypothetical protein